MTTLLLLFFVAFSQVSAASLQSLLERYGSEPNSPSLCEQIAVAYTQQQDFTHAADFFRQSLALNSNNVRASKNLATVLWFGGKKEESVRLFAILEKQIPHDPVPQLYLGLHAYEGNDLESAGDHFSRAGNLASSNPDVLIPVIRSYLVTGRARQAADILKASVVGGATDASTHRLLGDAYERLNQTAAAEDAYRQAIEVAPLDEENYLALAGFYVTANNLPDARTTLQNGLTRLPTSARLTLQQGLLFALAGDFAQARSQFNESLPLDPHWSLPLLALGITDLATGDAPAAAARFRQAKNVAPNDYRCYYFHALALARGQSDLSGTARHIEIRNELEHAITLAPAHSQPRVLLAQQYLDAGNLHAAELQLRTAMHVDPNNPEAVYKLALVLRREGRNAEASSLFADFATLKKSLQAQANEFQLLSEAAR